jgi:hypothetical protein
MESGKIKLCLKVPQSQPQSQPQPQPSVNVQKSNVTIESSNRSKTAVVTEHFPSLIDSSVAKGAFEYLRDNIQWEDGIRSRQGKTRLAKSIALDDNDLVHGLVIEAIKGMAINGSANKLSSLAIYGCYLNYYQKGSWTPNHTHPGTCQIIVSLGGTRTLQVGKKNYQMKNGDVAIFGASSHGVPKEETTDERISIAVFCLLNP